TGEPFDDIEFLTGKVARSQGGFKKTFLFGSCIVRENRDNPAINEAVTIKGCPPRTKDIIRILNEHGIKADFDSYVQYRKSLAARYDDRPQFQENYFMVSGK
ncbi:MAG: DUF362 domain-containing protein, partial [Firmicutes bacterium]|nr:DUF362 domain-containing protein [Bacillota bacterium]